MPTYRELFRDKNSRLSQWFVRCDFAPKLTFLKGHCPRFRGLLHSRGRRDYGRRHCELVIVVPGRPDGPSHLEEVSVEVLYTQRLARRTQYALRVVPVDGPTPCLGCGDQGLAVHHPVGNVLRTVVLDSLGNRGWKLWALAKGDTKDTRHRHRDSVQGKHRVPLRRHAHALY